MLVVKVKIQNTKIINEINDTDPQFESFNNFSIFHTSDGYMVL